MNLRAGIEKDIEDCVDIAEGMDEYFTEDALENMKKELKKHEFFVIEDEKETSGFISLDIKNEECADISWLAVKKDKRGSGFGRELIHHSENYLREKGIQILEVKTLSEDADYEPYARTRKFYEKMDFVHLETIDPYPGWDEGNPCSIYVKPL